MISRVALILCFAAALQASASEGLLAEIKCFQSILPIAQFRLGIMYENIPAVLDENRLILPLNGDANDGTYVILSAQGAETFGIPNGERAKGYYTFKDPKTNMSHAILQSSSRNLYDSLDFEVGKRAAEQCKKRPFHSCKNPPVLAQKGPAPDRVKTEFAENLISRIRSVSDFAFLRKDSGLRERIAKLKPCATVPNKDISTEAEKSLKKLQAALNPRAESSVVKPTGNR